MSSTGRNVTNPIPVSQVVDVKLNWSCLTPPSCLVLTDSLQALVDAICSIQDVSSLDYLCLTGVATREDLDNLYIQTLCDLETRVTSLENPSADPSYTLSCTTDGWDCTSTSDCITVTNPCDPLSITKEEQIQALTSRVIAQSAVIKDLCARIDALESSVNTLDTEVTALQNCCP